VDRIARVKVLACVKEVPDASAPKRIDPQTFRLDRSVPGALNEFDTHALEEALRVGEKEGDGEVVAILMGPPKAADSLRKALAVGADRAVHVADDALAGSDLVPTSRALAKAIERENPDLILFGQQAADSDGAVLWAAVADRLRLPVISQAASLELADGKAKVKRQTEYGYDVIEAPLPCVVAVSDAINEPRYPSLKGIMGAKKKPQDSVTSADLGLGPEEIGVTGSRTVVYAVGEPPPRGESRRIEDNGDAAEVILEFLSEKKLI
jgi:electron transfer flavoprotein beta subunit